MRTRLIPRIQLFTGAIAAVALLAALLISPTTALAEGECASISEQGIEQQMNMHASEVLVNCEVMPAGSATGEEESPLSGPGAFLGSDINLITGSETYPHVTQSESFVWSHGSTVVAAYNDSRGSSESPRNYSGVSVSTDGGESFTRLGPSSPFTGHGANYGDPIVVYDEKLEKWFAGDLAGGCGGQGIGLWTSTNAEEWSSGACAHEGSDDDRESMWVDNNPESSYYGRMYVSFNDFSAGGALKVTHSDNGTSWSSPVTLYSSFRRDAQITGSPDSEGIVFLVAQDENGGGAGNTGQRNYMYRSTNGGATWTSTTMGSTFTIAGSSACGGGYFPAIPPIWRETGWGEPAVGPNGVVQYVYAAHGEGSDESDIFYVRSTDNGETWSTPVRLNTDSSGEAQWMPSLRVTPSGIAEASWYDRRNTTNGENYQRFARISRDNGETWEEDEPLSTVLIPQPSQPDPNVQACYAGDYNYDTASANTGFDTWTDGRVSVEGTQVQKVFFHSLRFPPSATTLAASELTAFGAKLNGTVNPAGLATTYQFEYVDDSHYDPEAENPYASGSVAPSEPESVGSGAEDVEVSQQIEGLEPATTYHFRVTATNEEETIGGEDETFTTAGAPNPDWRIEGASLEELEAWEPYESAGTFTLESTALKAEVEIDCAESGSGTLGYEETIALSECETILNGSKSAACAPADTTIVLGPEFANAKEGAPLTTFNLGEEEECAVGEEFDLTAGAFSVQEGSEAVEFPVSMSGGEAQFGGHAATVSVDSIWQMTGAYKGKKFAYATGDYSQLNTDWRIEGASLEELEAWEPYESAGTFTLESTALKAEVEIDCAESGSGTLGYEETIALSECETILNGSKSAACAPADTTIVLGPEFANAKEGAPLTTFNLGEEEECAVGEEFDLTAGAFSVQEGSEAVEFPVSMSGGEAQFGGHAATVSVDSIWQMTGAYKGKKFAYATGDYSQLNTDWRIEGASLEELEAWEPYESAGTFTLESTALKAEVEIDCAESGSGTLGYEETIALSECETILNGSKSAACAPADTTIVLGPEFANAKEGAPLTTFNLGEEEECAVGEEFDLTAGTGFAMQEGSEAVEFPAQMSLNGYFGGHEASVSISSTWQLTGAYKGSEFGYGS